MKTGGMQGKTNGNVMGIKAREQCGRGTAEEILMSRKEDQTTNGNLQLHRNSRCSDKPSIENELCFGNQLSY